MAPCRRLFRNQDLTQEDSFEDRPGLVISHPIDQLIRTVDDALPIRAYQEIRYIASGHSAEAIILRRIAVERKVTLL